MSESVDVRPREPGAGEILALFADHRRGLHTHPVAQCSECTLDAMKEPMRFAVVEDSSALRDMLVEVIRDHFGTPVAVHPFADRPSLDELATIHPDVVLVDLLLGSRQSGLELVRDMRRDPRLGAVPVLVVTASRPGLDRYLAEAPLDNVAVLLKPFSLDQFHETLDGLLSGTPPALELPI